MSYKLGDMPLPKRSVANPPLTSLQASSQTVPFRSFGPVVDGEALDDHTPDPIDADGILDDRDLGQGWQRNYWFHINSLA